MSLIYRLLPLSLVASLGFAQLTTDQKVADFQALAGLYAKRYGAYEWKRDAMNFDLLNITPWLAQVQATKNDLDFYDVMVSYVAGLNDAHAFYSLPTTFTASLNFTVDIYDGKLLVDSINRLRLPVPEFPFVNGYELVSIDGQDAQKMLDGLLKYNVHGNPRSTRRFAASYLTFRPESVIPHAADVPEISTVVFRRPDGSTETYRIPWTKSGMSLTNVGTYITPNALVSHDAGEVAPDSPPPPDAPPAYMQVLARLQNCRLPDRAVNGNSSLTPVFAASLPATFVQRLGRSSADPFFSGVLTANGFKIGFIRVPSFSPVNTATALTAFATEIAYFQANTDALIVDETRNPGGNIAYVNAIVSYLIPNTWSSIPFAIRSTSEWVDDISSSYELAKSQGAPQSILDLLLAIKTPIVNANHQMRGTTDPIPIDDITIDRSPALDAKGNVAAYSKPLMVLMDELSASGGDAFAATIQDNHRGPLFGWRTMGAGGEVEGWAAGSYSLGSASVTEGLMVRNHPVVTTDYPTAPYIENIGVRPDIQQDYMTRDNLVQNGKPFVDAFVAAMVAQLQKGN